MTGEWSRGERVRARGALGMLHERFILCDSVVRSSFIVSNREREAPHPNLVPVPEWSNPPGESSMKGGSMYRHHVVKLKGGIDGLGLRRLPTE